MTVLSTDSFNRTNSTSTLGSTDGAGSLDPLAWTANTGTWGINSAQAYSPGGFGLATIELSTADIDISVTFTDETNEMALMFRLSDASTYWIWYTNGGTANLYKVPGFVQVGGTFTGGANGDVFRITANGSAINAYRNGVLEITATDSFNSTATKHGLWAGGSSSRFDVWTASTFASTTTATGTQATETDSSTSGTLLTSLAGSQATETDTGRAGDVIVPVPPTTPPPTTWHTFNPPTEQVVPNFVQPEDPTYTPIGNRLRRYYPVGPSGRAVWKLPFIDETTAAAYTFDQPYPWVDGQLVANGNLFPPDPVDPFERSSSNLIAQTLDKVFYGGHVYEINDAEVTGISLFLIENGYTPGDWIDMLKTVRFSFAFDTTDIVLTGATAYTPTAGDLVVAYSASIFVETAWNGTGTPSIHFGTTGDPTAYDLGPFSDFTIGATDNVVGGVRDAYLSTINSSTFTFEDTSPLTVMIDDGAGGNPNSTTGAAELVMVVMGA